MNSSLIDHVWWRYPLCSITTTTATTAVYNFLMEKDSLANKEMKTLKNIDRYLKNISMHLKNLKKTF